MSSILNRALVAPRAAGSRSLENPSVSLQDPEAWQERFGPGPTDSGESVTVASALSLSGFWAALKHISGDVSRMPLQTFRRPPADDEGRAPTPDSSHYLHAMIEPQAGMANEELTALKLWRRAVTQVLTYENGYVWSMFEGGRSVGLYPLLSDRTAVVRHRGRLHVVTEVGDSGELWSRPYDQFLHLEGLCLDNLAGCALVEQAREDIGVALASRKFKAKFFGKGMHAGGILQIPPGTRPKARRKVEQAIEEQRQGTDRAFATLVLEDGFKWHSTQVDAEKAQQSEIDEAAIRDLARRFLLSPSKLGVRDSISYNSLEQDRKDYHDSTLGYWLSMIVAELNTKLLTERERRQWLIGYKPGLALLFADASTLAMIATQALNARDGQGRPLVERNEARGWLQLPPLDDEELPGQDPPEEDPGDAEGTQQGEEGDAEGDEEAGREDRGAFLQWLEHESLRLVRRLRTHSDRVARRSAPVAWRAHVGELAATHTGPAADSLRPVALGLGRSPEELAGRLIGWYQEQLRRHGPAALKHIEDAARRAGADLYEEKDE